MRTLGAHCDSLALVQEVHTLIGKCPDSSDKWSCFLLSWVPIEKGVWDHSYILKQPYVTYIENLEHNQVIIPGQKGIGFSALWLAL